MFFKKTEELSQYLDSTSQLKLNDIKPTIEFVENKLLVEVMGRTFYDEINEKYTNDETNLTDRENELLHFIRLMVAPYAVYYYSAKSLQLSGNGLQRVESENTKTAYAYQKEDFREQALTEGEQAAENLIAFLFENAKEFETYTSSNEFKQLKDLFICSGREFGEMYSNPQPNRLYKAVKSFMKDVELLTIRKALQADLYNHLKEKSKENEPQFSDEEKELMMYLKKAISFLTIAKAIPHINVRVSANGITVVSDSTGGVRDMDKKKAADQTYIGHLMQDCQKSGETYLNEALQYIQANATKFEKYKKPNSVSYSPVNDKFQGTFGLV